MKVFIPFFLIAALFINCNFKQEIFPYTNFVPNGKGIVRFQFVNVNDTGSYWLLYNNHLPKSQFTGKFLITSDTVIDYEVNASFPTKVFFVNNYNHNVGGFCMVLPSDTLQLRIEDTIISFSGKTKEISEYLSRKKVNLYRKIPEKNETPDGYNARLDSTCRETLDNFMAYCDSNKLPEWFIEYEKSDIISACENLKHWQYQHRLNEYGQKFENKSQRGKLLIDKKIELRWLTDYTFNYLENISPAKYDTLLTPQNFSPDILFEYNRDNISALNGLLSVRLMSYYVSSRLLALLDVVFRNDNKLKFKEINDKANKFYNELIPYIKDTICLNLVNSYKTQKYNEFHLPVKQESGEEAPFYDNMKGQKASNFYLEDINGKKVNLSDYAGKLICLNFWGTYCSPCIKSIPEKNELLGKYESQNFVLINILLDNDFRKWREIVKDWNFNGLHLKCTGNWDKILAEKYKIGSIPHYTLIDKNGIIIMNNVPHDSLGYYVKENL